MLRCLMSGVGFAMSIKIEMTLQHITGLLFGGFEMEITKQDKKWLAFNLYV